MRARSATLYALALAAGTATAQTITARGVVYEDRNADGARQAGEPGIPSVAVSNGVDVVLTDERGNYRIEIDDRDAVVFVVKPRGFQVPLDAQNLPRFSYSHKPEGSLDDGFVWEGVAPTGPLPASIDFGLRRVEEPDAFTVIAFGDPQPYSLEQIDFFRRESIEQLFQPGPGGTSGNNAGAALGISLGDLVGDRLDMFEPLNQAQALLGVPWYNVYGNHDMNFMSGDSALTAEDPDRHADETFERVYGPTDYAFQHGSVHFILLDNVIYQGFEGYRDNTGEGWPEGRHPQTGNYRGGLRPEQIEFVKNYLAVVPTDELVVLAMHVPLEMHGPGVHRVPEKRELFEALSSHPHTLSLSGHTHLQEHWFFGARDGYTPGAPNQHTIDDPQRFPEPVHHHINAVTVSGSWYGGIRDETGVPHTTMRDGAPNGYTLLHFDGNRYRTEFRASRRPAEDQMKIALLDGETPVMEASPGEDRTVFVNVYNGARGDDVRWRLVPNPALGAPPTGWSPMTFKWRTDPVYGASYQRELAASEAGAANRVSPEPRFSYHVWETELPKRLPAGTHVIEVRHTDLYGKTHTGRISFRATD
ncbi:MAG: calcineurin-like phosphoesterase family protein [Planctomycetota bacterium]